MARNLFLAILALVILAVGFLIGRACTEGRLAALHRVTITATTAPPGLEVRPDTVVVYPGDAIAWVADSGDWLVRLSESLAVVPSIVRGAQGDTAVAQVALDADVGEYKYTVTLVVGGTPIDLDPLVVVRKDERLGSE